MNQADTRIDWSRLTLEDVRVNHLNVREFLSWLPWVVRTAILIEVASRSLPQPNFLPELVESLSRSGLPETPGLSET